MLAATTDGSGGSATPATAGAVPASPAPADSPPANTGLDDVGLDDTVLADEAVALARRLLAASLQSVTGAERRRQRRLGRLLGDPAGRQLLFGLTDQVLRVADPSLAARRYADLVAAHPTGALGAVDGALLRAGGRVAPLLPRLVMPLVTRRLKAETRGIVLPADDPAFGRHVRRRRAEGVRLNVNPLGEAILSDDEAAARMHLVCERIDRPDVDYLSVKLSSIVANLDALSFDESLERVTDRLVDVYRRAAHSVPPTFVNLDMEEYRDLELTLQAFMGVLSMSEFHATDAGIVLQAYLPDSHDALERLGVWAAQRRRAGGGRVKVRLVKGANLAMETVEAELHGWRAAPYGSKADVDASYKRMLDSALRDEWREALRIGVASHNLFDVAWALVIARARGALDRVEIEMLEGMAPAQARAVRDEAGGLLMYAPVVADADFDACIAYLSRRLDENTQRDNFLRALFDLVPDSAAFDEQVRRFRQSVAERVTVPTGRRRMPLAANDGFANEPDGDATDPAYRAALGAAMATPRAPRLERIDSVEAVDRVMATAAATVPAVWSPAERGAWLHAAADRLSSCRAEAVALMAHAVGKSAREGDPEVSEAIDFCRYYATAGIDGLCQAQADGVEVSPRGVIVVVGPWNFPLAIPVGGVAAALAAGNSVVLKPAPEAAAVGAWIGEQFWAAGVPRDVLQVAVCPDNEVGARLVTHPHAETVVLTGSFETAAMFLGWKPQMRLFAETSGKNALVITASADLDLAIADLVRSAFGHAGQKCSAASLGIVEADVYDDPAFMERLAAAVRSLRVRPATDVASMVGPLVGVPQGALQRALTSLEPGEQWLVQPRQLDDSGRLWSPGVRTGVQPGSWFHRTECFGPVLGLLRARDLDHAIELQNATDYGLTGGIHSLDEDEVGRWLAGVQVGNAYVNRHITGAIVQRQPFGGWKRSSVGGGAKAGGPGYVLQFARLANRRGRTAGEAAAEFESAWATHFAAAHDPSGLVAESNVLRYMPLRRVAVRHDGSRPSALEVLRLAARVAGVELAESDARQETDAAFAVSCAAPGRAGAVDRVRLLGALDTEARRMLRAADVVVDADEPVACAAVELRRWVREQAVSATRHRHGRVDIGRAGSGAHGARRR